ncbi:MAG: hypothetical protein JOY66_09480 [Acetobacteraceae bacterium]|nr:hypothetical protein [Acetobacteraceae bacterium]
MIGDTLHRMVNPATRAVSLPALPVDLAAVPRATVSACGSAVYAGLVGHWWFEAIARVPADTLAPLRSMREQGGQVGGGGAKA